MKKIFLLSVLGLLSLKDLVAQTFAQYRGDLSPYIGYYNSDAHNMSGLMICTKFNTSLFGLFYKDNTKFFLADCIGADLGVASIAVKGGKSSFGLALGLEAGVVAGYAFTDEIEVSVKCMARIFAVTDLAISAGNSFYPVIMPSIRVKRYIVTLGFGNGRVSGTGMPAFVEGDKGVGFMIEPRWMFSKSAYVLGRYENYKNNIVGYKYTMNQISLGVGFFL